MSVLSRTANSVIGVLASTLGSRDSSQTAALSNAYEVVNRKLDKMAEKLNTATGEIELREEVALSHLAGSFVPHFSEEEVAGMKEHVEGMIEEKGLTGRVNVEVEIDRPVYCVDWDPATITLTA